VNELIKKAKESSDVLGDISDDKISVEESGEKGEEKGANIDDISDGVDKENSLEKEVVLEGGIEGEINNYHLLFFFIVAIFYVMLYFVMF
jgi:hypothetical protein